MQLLKLVIDSVKHKASDLHLSAGKCPLMRLNGSLAAVSSTILDSDSLEQMLLSTLSSVQQTELASHRELDYVIDILPEYRLRGHLFYQQSGLSAAYRLISNELPTLQAINAPDGICRLVEYKNGLVIITGPTGSGKSTTLAALLSCFNRTENLHIITLEDPIEFLFSSQQCLIQQRQIGLHTHSFVQGLRAALRQDLDILLIGELRDLATIRLALSAAETGHLVLTSLHASSVLHGIERLIDGFPTEERALIRIQLSQSLQAIIAQELVLSKKGGRIALFEVMINIPSVANLIREGKLHQLLSIMQMGRNTGMQTKEQSLLERRAQGWL